DPIYSTSIHPGMHVMSTAKQSVHPRNSYYVVLQSRWANPSTLAMVGRFRHKNGYVDAIYLPASNPTSLGWALAVHALHNDRVVAHDPSKGTRVVRVMADGTQQFTTGNTARPMKGWQKPSAADLSVVDKEFRKDILRQLQRQHSKGSRAGG